MRFCIHTWQDRHAAVHMRGAWELFEASTNAKTRSYGTLPVQGCLTAGVSLHSYTYPTNFLRQQQHYSVHPDGSTTTTTCMLPVPTKAVQSTVHGEHIIKAVTYYKQENLSPACCTKHIHTSDMYPSMRPSPPALAGECKYLPYMLYNWYTPQERRQQTIIDHTPARLLIVCFMNQASFANQCKVHPLNRCKKGTEASMHIQATHSPCP